ncbi:hypothetical protein D3C81_792980 [compost metagenome]
MGSATIMPPVAPDVAALVTVRVNCTVSWPTGSVLSVSPGPLVRFWIDRSAYCWVAFDSPPAQLFCRLGSRLMPPAVSGGLDWLSPAPPPPVQAELVRAPAASASVCSVRVGEEAPEAIG